MGDQHLRHSLSTVLCFVVFVIYFVKLSHSFPKQYRFQLSGSVAVSELDILDVRSLEGQDALLVL